MIRLITLLFVTGLLFSVWTTAPLLGEKGKAKCETTVKSEKEKPLELTLTELAKFNGKNGAKAYVAVDGVIYDVTGVPAWKGGKHKGNMAGQDITELIKKESPHKGSVLKKRKVVGKIVPEKKITK